MSPVFSRYACSASSTKIVSIVGSNKENREPDEGVSQAPDSAFPWQDCQKRFPHRFARSGLMLTNARRRPQLRLSSRPQPCPQVTDFPSSHPARNTEVSFSVSEDNYPKG
jgi:hypothetical protein